MKLWYCQMHAKAGSTHCCQKGIGQCDFCREDEKELESSMVLFVRRAMAAAFWLIVLAAVVKIYLIDPNSAKVLEFEIHNDEPAFKKGDRET